MTLKKKVIQVSVEVYATDNMDLAKIKQLVINDLKPKWSEVY